MTIECEKCQAPGTPDKVQCAKCGGRVVRVCGSCGLKNSLAKRWCDSCGSKLDAQSQPQGPKPAAAAPPPPKPTPSKPPPDVFVFESLAESAANELEAAQKAKAAQAKPAAPKPQPELKRPPEPAPPPKAEPPPEPKRTPEPAPEKPKPLAPAPGLNALDLKLDAPPPSKASSPPPSGLSIPHTVIGRVGAPPPAAKKPAEATPPPSKPSQAAPPPAAKPSAPAAKPAPAPPAPAGGARKVAALPSMTKSISQYGAKLSTAAALVLLLVGGGMWAARKRHLGRPEVQAPSTARRYLNAVKAGDFVTAYAMLTEASRRACPLETFKTIRGGGSWEFSDVAFVAVDRDLAFIRYRLREAGRDAEEDHLVFQREGGVWRRAFTWSLLRDAEEALERGNAEEALRVAKQAREVNPRDPAPQAYVCQALHGLRDPRRGEELVRECRIVLELADAYPAPVSLPPAELYHARAILGDTFKNVLQNHRAAIDQYTAMLLFPRIPLPDQCEVLLGRAESWLALKGAENAVKDLERAAGLCARPADVEYAKELGAVYGGSATRKAIDLAQGHRLEAGGQTLLEWRKQERARLSQQWKAQGRGSPPEEDWVAQHVGAAQYRVDVRAGSTVLFSARVDLSDRSVQAETH